MATLKQVEFAQSKFYKLFDSFCAFTPLNESRPTSSVSYKCNDLVPANSHSLAGSCIENVAILGDHLLAFPSLRVEDDDSGA